MNLPHLFRRNSAPPTPRPHHWAVFAVFRELLSERYGTPMTSVHTTDSSVSGAFMCNGRRYVAMIYEENAP